MASTKLRITFVAAAVLGASMVGNVSTAWAEETPVVVEAEQVAKTERVAFADLDLASIRDQKRLNARIGSAIERVCDLELGRDGLQPQVYYRCAAFAWTDARPKIEGAVLAARSMASNGASATLTAAISVRALQR